MVNRNFLIIGAVIGIIILIVVARTQKAFASTDIVDVNNQTGGIENAIPDVGQTELQVPIDFGLQGILGQANEADSSQEGSQQILANDFLLGEDAIRAINDKLSSVFDEVAGDKGGLLINSKQASDVKTTSSSTVTNAKRGSVSIDTGGLTSPLGNRMVDGQVIAGIRGKPLAQKAISQTQPTLTGTLDTPTGGKRKIAGSQALFDRLKKNLGQS